MHRVIASLVLAASAFAADPDWPGFRGPFSNPSSANSNLPDKWSKTSNIEWTAALPQKRIRDVRPWWVRRYWKRRNRWAQIGIRP